MTNPSNKVIRLLRIRLWMVGSICGIKIPYGSRRHEPVMCIPKPLSEGLALVWGLPLGVRVYKVCILIGLKVVPTEVLCD